jgi:hypothetical protein
VTEAESNHSDILQILINGDGYLDDQHTFGREIKPPLIWTRMQAGDTCSSAHFAGYEVHEEDDLSLIELVRRGLCDGQHNGVQWAVRPGPAPTLWLLPAAQRSWTLINAAVAARSWDGKATEIGLRRRAGNSRKT